MPDLSSDHRSGVPGPVRAVGINHVALEVGDLDEALAFYGRFLDFLDPWGNRVEIVGYDNIQFSKTGHVLRGMGLGHLGKTDEAIAELTEKGMGPD